MMRIADPASMIDAINRDETLPMQARAALARTVPQDPVSLSEWKVRMFLMATDAAKTLPKTETRDAGGTVETLKIDPITGAVSTASSVAKTQTPDNKASNARMAADAAAARAVQIRGQNMTDERARELNAVARETAGEKKRVEGIEKGVTKYSDTLQKEGIPELEEAVSGAENALGRYKPGQVPGVGRLSGAVPSALLSDEGNDVRQAVATVRNIVLNARSGAAVTDQELRRLVEELGTGLGQSESALKRGLGRVRARLDKIKENAAAGVSDDVKGLYEERGGVPIKRGGAKPGTDAVAEALKKYGN
jgi:hypothetical protein